MAKKTTKRTTKQETLVEASQPGTPNGPLRFEISSTPGKKTDAGLEWTMKAKLGNAYAPRHLEAASLIGQPVRLTSISGSKTMGVRVNCVRHKLDKDGKVVVEIVTTGDAQSPEMLGLIVEVESLQATLPGVSRKGR